LESLSLIIDIDDQAKASGWRAMYSVTRVQRGLRRRAARWLMPADLPTRAQLAYYPQQPSCQIPELWFIFERFLGRREAGTFVEVGAYDGVFVSNTWGLAARGWHGWMVEPVPQVAALCRSKHAEHHNVKVVEQAIGSAGQDEVRLFVAGTLTTANADAFREYLDLEWAQSSLTGEEIVVSCGTLDAFLAKQRVPVGFDVLVVDVEGFETEVFSGLDLAAWRPALLVVELVELHPDLSHGAGKDALLCEAIQASGYRVVFKDQINTVFVRNDVWHDAFIDGTSVGLLTA